MTKPTIMYHNTKTDEIIEREMNAQELAQYEVDLAQVKAKADRDVLVAEAKAVAEAKLKALGLTADDLKALGL